MEQKTHKITGNILLVLVMTVVLMLAGIILGNIVTILILKPLPISQEGATVILSYLPFIGIAALTLLYTWLTRKDVFRRYFRGSRGNTWKMLGLGLVTGFAMNGACILAAWLHGDVHFAPGSIGIGWIAISFAVVFIQSATEELLTRGYLFYHLRDRYGRTVALAFSSVLFSLLHLGNDGINWLALVNIAAIGLFYSLSVEYLDSLWFAMGNHAMWNFTQNMIFGLPNSGLVSAMSVLKLEAASDSWAYSAVFGVEAALPATLVCIGASVGLYIWARKHPSGQNCRVCNG